MSRRQKEYEEWEKTRERGGETRGQRVVLEEKNVAGGDRDVVTRGVTKTLGVTVTKGEDTDVRFNRNGRQKRKI